jgi:hypothetical protein
MLWKYIMLQIHRSYCCSMCWFVGATCKKTTIALFFLAILASFHKYYINLANIRRACFVNNIIQNLDVFGSCINHYLLSYKLLTPKGLREPNGLFWFWVGYRMYLKLLEFLRLLEGVGMDGSFPMRRSM